MKGAGDFFLILSGLVIIASVAFFSYYGALDNGFVYDDPLLIHDNPLVMDPSLSIFEILKQPYFNAGGDGAGFYRPLMSLIFRMEMDWYEGTPAGFHRTNILIHVGTSFCLFLILFLLIKSPLIAFCPAVIFACHPITTESIAWISGRTDPLAFLLMGFSLVFLILSQRRPQKKVLLVFALGTFFFSLFVKEISYVTPVAVLTLLLALRSENPIKITALYAGMTLLVLILSRLAPEGDLSSLYSGKGEVGERFVTFLTVIPAYLGKIFNPQNLSIAHPVSLATTPFTLAAFLGLAALLAAVFGLVIGVKQKNPGLALGASLFLFGLVAVSNLVPIPFAFQEMDFPFFERYLYIPLAGLLLGLFSLAPKKQLKLQAIAVCISIGLCVFLIPKTRERTSEWKDDETLFYSAVLKWQGAPSLWFNLGQAYFNKNKMREAQAAFFQAHRMNPDLIMARVQEAMCWGALKNPNKAMSLLSQIVKEHPKNGQAWEAIGFLNANLKVWDLALEGYAKAAPLLNNNQDTLASRQNCLQQIKMEVERLYLHEKDYNKVISKADWVLKLIPGISWAHEAKGLSLLELKKEKEAIKALETAVILNAKASIRAMATLVELYRKQGQTQKAQSMHQKFKETIKDLPISVK